MVLTLVAGIGDLAFGHLQLNPNGVTIRSAMDIALGAIVLMVLAITATRLAGDLVSGGPSLGAGTMVGAAGGAGLLAYGAGQTAYGAGTFIAGGAVGASLASVRAASKLHSPTSNSGAGGSTPSSPAPKAASSQTSHLQAGSQRVSRGIQKIEGSGGGGGGLSAGRGGLSEE